MEPVLYPILRGDFISQGKARSDSGVPRLVWGKGRRTFRGRTFRGRVEKGENISQLICSDWIGKIS